VVADALEASGTSARFLGILTLGLGVALVASAQPGTPGSNLSPTIAAVKKLADSVDRPDVARQAKKLVDELDACEVSRVFVLTRPRRGGGLGIGSAVKAGHKDSIEDLVRDWSGPRPPTKEELQTHQDDLLRVARVVQAMAELAPFRRDIYVPANNEKMAAGWRQVSAEFKTVSRALREAIEKSDQAETRRAAVQLQQTCNNCHKLVGR
jgi:hypothetical protein